MMEMLIRSPGMCISTNKFLEEIWNGNDSTDINVVWLYTSYLHKKISAIGGDLRIKVSQDNNTVSLERAAEKEKSDSS